MSLLDDRMRFAPHQGPLADATGSGAVGNPACGDVLRLHVRVEGDTIAAARFESIGSVYQLATASILCDRIVGDRVGDARGRRADAILEALPDLPRNKHHLARLCIDALQAALDDHEEKGAGRAPSG